MISAAELARQAGVKRQAITYIIKKNKLPRIIAPDGAVGFDENDPAARDYIAQQSAQRMAKHNSGEAPAEPGKEEHPKPPPQARRRPDPPPSTNETSSSFAPQAEAESDEAIGAGLEHLQKGDLDRLKVREQIIKARIANRVEQRKYLPREEVKRVFGLAYSVHTSTLRPMGSRIAPDLASLFGSTDDTLILKAQELIDAENYRALGMIKRELQNGLARLKAGRLPETTHE